MPRLGIKSGPTTAEIEAALPASVVRSSQEGGPVSIPTWAEQGLELHTGPGGELKWGPPPVFAIKDPKYGAKGDTIDLLLGVEVTSGGHALKCSTAAFTAADVGKTVVVKGAGASGEPLGTTISARVSATEVTLAAASSATLANTSATYGTDDGPASAKAWEDILANSGWGTWFAGFGNFTMGTKYPGSGTLGGCLPIPREAHGITIKGAGGINRATTITLTPGCHRFIDFKKVADHDLFQNWSVSGLDVNANNIGGKGHVTIGTLPGEGSTLTRVRSNRGRIRDISSRGVPWDSTENISRPHIGFAPAHLENNEATQDYITDLKIEDVEMQGGRYGLSVTAELPTSLPGLERRANYWLDDIEVHRCTFKGGATFGEANTFQFSGAFLFGQFAKGGRLRVSYLKGSAVVDVGMEIDQWMDWRADHCEMIDIAGPSFYHNAFNVAEHIGAQRGHWHDCKSRYAEIPDTIGTGWKPKGFMLGPVESESSYEGNPLGHITLTDCEWHKPNKHRVVKGECIYIDSPSKIHSLTIENFKMIMDEAAFQTSNVTGTPGEILAWIHPAAHGGGYCSVRIKNFKALINGTYAPSAGWELRPLGVSGEGVILDVDGYDIDLSPTAVESATAPSTILLTLGKDSGSHMQGRVAGMSVAQNTGAITPYAIGFEAGLTINGVIRVERNNLINIPSGQSNPFFFAGNTQKAGVTYRDNRLPSSVKQPERWEVSGASYTMTGVEENIACTGTGTTAQEIVVMEAASVYPGRQFTIYDESGGAAAHNITVKLSGSNTFTDGTTSKKIETNGSALRIRAATGTKFAVV